MLQSVGSQRVGHKLATKQEQLCQQGLVSVSQNLPSPGSCPKDDPQPTPHYLSLGLHQWHPLSLNVLTCHSWFSGLRLGNRNPQPGDKHRPRFSQGACRPKAVQVLVLLGTISACCTEAPRWGVGGALDPTQVSNSLSLLLPATPFSVRPQWA